MKAIKVTNADNGRFLALTIILLSLSMLTTGQKRTYEDYVWNNLKDRMYQNQETNILYSHVLDKYEPAYTRKSIISKPASANSYEIFFEDEILVEDWMRYPFNVKREIKVKPRNLITYPNEVQNEETVPVENRITIPDEILNEDPVPVEEWMTAPFESAINEPVMVQKWMGTPNTWLN
ncbi:MAG TPA: hypothetical protein ENO01_03070 [Candidatus Marinimicrobia bacterium]|nr:hypothetical protein [Candidatus Neomarinimicrobiota bacterium]